MESNTALTMIKDCLYSMKNEVESLYEEIYKVPLGHVGKEEISKMFTKIMTGSEEEG